MTETITVRGGGRERILVHGGISSRRFETVIVGVKGDRGPRGDGDLDEAGLLNRANHTGTQAISTVVGLQEALNSKFTNDSTITAWAGINFATDTLGYATDADEFATTPFTSFARSILDDTDEATFKATVNLEIGTDVQAQNVLLESISGLSVVAGDLFYGDDTDSVDRLAAGTDTHVLTLAAGLPAWEPPVPIGTVLPFAGSMAPASYLLCNGSEYEIATYPGLDTVLGTTYGARTDGSGGAGSTHGRLPDLRGRVVAGKDDMGGSSANRLTDQSGGLNGDVLGGTGGSETHTLAETEMPAHTHSVPGATPGSAYANAAGGDDAASTTSSSAGGGQAHNNVQPTIILNYIIRAL